MTVATLEPQVATGRQGERKNKPLPRSQWAHGQHLYQHGATHREIAAALGVSHKAVQKHIEQDGWQRDDAAIAARDRAHAEAMRGTTQARERAWAERRAAEATAAGEAAQEMRSHIFENVERKDAPMVRACTIAYGVFIDKAQLLSGAATDRTDVSVREGLDAELERLAGELSNGEPKPTEVEAVEEAPAR